MLHCYDDRSDKERNNEEGLDRQYGWKTNVKEEKFAGIIEKEEDVDELGNQRIIYPMAEPIKRELISTKQGSSLYSPDQDRCEFMITASCGTHAKGYESEGRRSIRKVVEFQLK